MQTVSELLHTASLQKFYHKGVLRLRYVKLEILNGLNVYIPRIGDHSAILTCSRYGRKAFTCHISAYELDEFITMLEFSEAGGQDQQWILGRFEFRITILGDAVSIGVESVEVAGKRAQLRAAIFKYRALHQRNRRLEHARTIRLQEREVREL